MSLISSAVEFDELQVEDSVCGSSASHDLHDTVHKNYLISHLTILSLLTVRNKTE